MANNNSVSSICNVNMDTVKSLEEPLQYDKEEEVYMKWGTQNTSNDAENNIGTRLKSSPPVSAPADSSDNMKPSPEFQHPTTPQSYHSAPSPYQNPDQAAYSPWSHFSNQLSHSAFPQNEHNHQTNQWEQSQFNQEYHRPTRYHPYNVQERVSPVSSSSPLYVQPLNQPTPNQCGFVRQSVVQLNEHCNTSHAGASTQPPSFQQFPVNLRQYSSVFQSDAPQNKDQHEESSDILDLDSQKAVYQGNEVDQPSTCDQSQAQVRNGNPREVPAMIWEAQKLYGNPQMKDQNIFTEQKPFHPNQNFGYNQDKILSLHHGPEAYMHTDQELYPGVQMQAMTDCAGSVSSANPDIKTPYSPYEPPVPSQISSTQPANSTSTALPSFDVDGANGKSNGARRPKTYECTACNKWFTSAGHLKRHYNTTLHKNAVRSSGQPDPATMPISNHHHPARDSLPQRAQQQAADSNTQSPVPADDSRASDHSLQPPYAAQNYHRSLSTTAMHSISPYSHLQQGNIDHHFMCNNPLANHPLPYQVGSHPLNLGSQPPYPGMGIMNDSNQNSKGVVISSSGNPSNGESGLSVTQNCQNHHLGAPQSVSTSNFLTPVLTQSTPALMASTMPPFSHLAVNPYSQRSTDPYVGQNFQQTIALSYPNAMAPHVMDMATSNLHTASLDTIGEPMPEVVAMENDTLNNCDPLPGFCHLKTTKSASAQNLITPNVGGSIDFDETPNNPSSSFMEEIPSSETSAINNLEIEGIMDYENKENYGRQMTSPNIPKRAKRVHQSQMMRASPSTSSAVSPPHPATPLVESNKIVQVAPPGVHKCFECNRVFNKTCYLTQHNKTFHSGEKPHKCERCGKRFSEQTSYKKHCAKHSNDKPHKCLQCPKSFNHKTDLRRHMWLHTGDKPYQCNHCEKGFIRKDHMLKHCDTHRKKSARGVSS